MSNTPINFSGYLLDANDIESNSNSVTWLTFETSVNITADSTHLNKIFPSINVNFKQCKFLVRTFVLVKLIAGYSYIVFQKICLKTASVKMIQIRVSRYWFLIGKNLVSFGFSVIECLCHSDNVIWVRVINLGLVLFLIQWYFLNTLNTCFCSLINNPIENVSTFAGTFHNL